MIIIVKNKDTLLIDDFRFKCSIGEKGFSKKKVEGDLTTPKGVFNLGNIYYRSDRVQKPFSKLKSISIKRNMGWCDDPNSKFYNKLIKIKKNLNKFKGSAIFLHLTTNYLPTKGCVALSEKDFLILAKLINKKTKIKIN